MDSNDNDPVFTRTFYNASIPENSEAGIKILQVHATDKDTSSVQQPIKYSIASGVGDFFSIDPSTGVIKTGNEMNM